MGRLLVDPQARHLVAHEFGERSSARHDQQTAAVRQQGNPLQERSQRGTAAEAPPDLE